MNMKLDGFMKEIQNIFVGRNSQNFDEKMDL